MNFPKNLQNFFQLRDSFRSAFGRNGAGGSKKPGFQPRNGENSLCIIDDSSEITSHDQTHLDSVESLRSALQEKDNRYVSSTCLVLPVNQSFPY